jgi:hypothetical protein
MISGLSLRTYSQSATGGPGGGGLAPPARAAFLTHSHGCPNPETDAVESGQWSTILASGHSDVCGKSMQGCSQQIMSDYVPPSNLESWNAGSTVGENTHRADLRGPDSQMLLSRFRPLLAASLVSAVMKDYALFRDIPCSGKLRCYHRGKWTSSGVLEALQQLLTLLLPS